MPGTFRFVLQNMTACVMVRVSYRSHNVSNFHSSRSTATKNCLIPSNVNSSLTIIKIIAYILQQTMWDTNICEGRNLPFYQDTNRVCHKPCGHFKDLVRQCSADKYNLWRKEMHELTLLCTCRYRSVSEYYIPKVPVW